MKPIVPGQLLADRFLVERSLGAGGLAEVFAARDQQSGAEVALKVLHLHFALEPGLSARFRRELAVTRGLVHPGIVRVFDLHEHLGVPFFSMELLEGESLAQRVARGPLPPEEARRIVREVCAALAHAHAQAVVHRDLKPHNVFMTSAGAVKLLDFGLARVVGEARLTATSTVMGTPGYIAPEVLRGIPADARADVYALGATWFELLTGQRAFTAIEPALVLRAQAGRGPSPRSLQPGVPERDDALVRRALHEDPEQRFLDARQTLRALDGEEVPQAMEAPPALVAGDHDVYLAGNRQGAGQRGKALLQQLSLPDVRVGVRQLLARGASRESALAYAEHCRTLGLGVAVRPSPRARSLWARLPWVWSALAGAAGAAAMVGLGHLFLTPPEEMPTFWGGAVLAALSLGGFVKSLHSGYHSPVLPSPPAGEPALWRLVTGVQARVKALREQVAQLPPARQMLAGDLVAAGSAAEESVLRLARDLSARPALPVQASAGPALPEDPEAITLPKGTQQRALDREQTVARILEVAAALDDALAAAGSPGAEAKGRAESVSAALRSLGGE